MIKYLIKTFFYCLDFYFIENKHKTKFYDFVCIRHDGIGDQIIWDKYLIEILNLRKNQKILLICSSNTIEYIKSNYPDVDNLEISYKKYSLNIFYRLKCNFILSKIYSDLVILPCFPNKYFYHDAIARILKGKVIKSDIICKSKVFLNGEFLIIYENETSRYEKLLAGL